MGTSERWIDQQIKERNRRLVRKHWWRLALGGLVVLGLGAATWLVVPDLEVPVWGVIPAVCFAVLVGYWEQLAGTANLVNGRDAERWTSKELRKVCGPGWHVVDGISFAFHDVDHVLVGPGGVYAIETKYTDSVIDLDTLRGQEWATRWADQAREAALSVRYLLWNETRKPVTAAVLVWGSDVSGTPRHLDGVPILRRRNLHDDSVPWRRGLDALSKVEVDGIVAELKRYRDARVEYDRRNAHRKAA